MTATGPDGAHLSSSRPEVGSLRTLSRWKVEEAMGCNPGNMRCPEGGLRRARKPLPTAPPLPTPWPWTTTNKEDFYCCCSHTWFLQQHRVIYAPAGRQALCFPSPVAFSHNIKLHRRGTSPGVQWLRLCFRCRGCGFNPWWGNFSPTCLRVQSNILKNK